MAKRDVTELLSDERDELEALSRRGQCSARKLTRARALLLSDQGEAGPGWIDTDIAAALGITTRCIQMLRKRAVERGPYAGTIDWRFTTDDARLKLKHLYPKTQP